MDFLKVQLERVRESLAGLSPSQKMLSAALVVIIAMTMVWFGRYAGSAEMVPLLDQPLTQEELGRIQTNLTMNGVEFKAAGDGKLLVPADKQYSAVANLAFLNLLPRNTTSGFDDMIKQLTAWDGQDRQNAVFNHGKEMTLERVISDFPGVSVANVLIDPQFKRQIGRDVEPTATVTVTLKDGVSGTKQMALACANFVAGAQAGLSPGKIKVLLNGKLFPIRDTSESPDGGMEAANVLEIQQATEKMITDKLLKQYDFIEGVRVLVTVKVNNSAQSIEQIQHPKDDSLIVDQKVMSRSSEQQNNGHAGGEAGVVANAGGTVTAGSGGAAVSAGSPNTETQDSTDAFIAAGKTTKITKTPAGEPTPVGASVRVPRSYFVMVAKNGDPSAKEPDAATLEKVIADEIPKIRKDVMVCTSIRTPDGITVEPYTDLLLSKGQSGVATAGISMMLGGHVKDIVLGGLALASLFMMSMIVRKGTPPAPAPIVAAKPAGPMGPSRLDASEEVAGEVTAGSPSLDAVELDDDTIRTQQMLNQVTSMVGDNPDAAATLIKRWMNQR